MYYALLEAVTQEQSWENGVSRIYLTLAQDFLYENPYLNVTFLDNHDISRFYSVIGEDLNKFKSGVSLLLTLRGIPSLYYGTEILLTGSGGMFGEAGRKDFPGGWKEDKSNKFKAKGRTDQEQEAFEFVKKLANYRKATPALQNGKLVQFVPENGIYVFFRYDADKTILVITNSNNKPATVPTARFSEYMAGFTKAKNVVTEKIIDKLSEITLERNSTLILELQ